MFWQWFYLTLVSLTLVNSHLPIRPLFGRSHVLGAEIIAVAWLASWAAREWRGDWSPVEANAAIDLSCVLAFTFIAVQKKALWAAASSLLHIAMLVLHFAFGVTGQVNEAVYLWTLNSLFAACLLVINTAIFAGKQAWGERVDQYLVAHLRGYSWSGLRSRGVSRHAG